MKAELLTCEDIRGKFQIRVYLNKGKGTLIQNNGSGSICWILFRHLKQLHGCFDYIMQMCVMK